RLSRLTYPELLDEYKAASEYIRGRHENLAKGYALVAQFERDEKDAELRALSEKQSALARRPRLQPAILAAARHYRGRGMDAKEAWEAIRKSPFTTDDGEVVEIDGPNHPRSEQTIRKVLRDRRQPKRAIRFGQWRKRYWTAGAQPG